MDPENASVTDGCGADSASRRRVLTLGAAAAAAGLAGCSGDLFGGGGPLGGSSLNYPQWLYEPGEVTDVDHYGFTYLEPTTIDEYEDEFDEQVFARLESREEQFELTGVDFDEVNNYLSFGTVVVLDASFDQPDVVEELEDADFDDDDEIGGYVTYYDDDEDRGVAIKNSTIVVARRSGEESAQDIVETVLETKSGEESRYEAESEAFGVLSQRLGRTTIVAGGTHEPTDDSGSSTIQYGETVTGALETSDSVLNGRYVDTYRFSGSEGDQIALSMRAPDGDTLLRLRGPGGEVIQTDDDGGDGFNSRLVTELPTSGVYTVVATSYSDRDTFEYALDLQSNAPASELTGNFENQVARGSATTVEGDTASRTWVLVFEDRDDIDTDDIEDWVDEGEQFDDYDDVSINTNGRAVLVEGTIDTDDVSNPF
jgi:hypothetical protein